MGDDGITRLYTAEKSMQLFGRVTSKMCNKKILQKLLKLIKLEKAHKQAS